MNKAVIPVVIILLLASLSFGSVSHQTDISSASKPKSESDGGLQNSSWPMFHYNAQRIGRCPYGPDLTVNCPELKWECYLNPGGTFSTPAIGEDGTIFIGVNDFHQSFFAINPNGTEKWRFDAGNWVQTSPAIGADGIVYFGDDSGNFYSFYPNGTMKWKRHIGVSWILSSPVIDKNGIIYTSSLADSKVIAMNPDGTIKWFYFTDDWIYSSPALAEDGTVYIGSNDRQLYAINPNGTLKWRYSVGLDIQDTPAVSSEGIIYFGCWDHCFYALNPNGTLKWKVNVGNDIDDSSPAIGSDGTIYIGNLDGKIFCFYPNGTIKWAYQTNGDIQTSPTIDKNGIIYCGSEDEFLYALNPDGTLRWKYNTGAEIYDTSPVINVDGIVYIGSWGPYLRALDFFHDNIPTNPTITGQLNGKIKNTYDYLISSTDIDNDNVSYYLDWGDGSNTDWLGPYQSGEQVTQSHTWTKKGSYTIKVKARDGHCMESNWSTLQVTMPLVYEPPHFRFLDWLFERFPNAFPILRYFLESK